MRQLDQNISEVLFPTLQSMPLGGWLATFSLKGQRVSIVGCVGHVVSVTISRCSAKAATENM